MLSPPGARSGCPGVAAETLMRIYDFRYGFLSHPSRAKYHVCFTDLSTGLQDAPTSVGCWIACGSRPSKVTFARSAVRRRPAPYGRPDGAAPNGHIKRDLQRRSSRDRHPDAGFGLLQPDMGLVISRPRQPQKIALPLSGPCASVRARCRCTGARLKKCGLVGRGPNAVGASATAIRRNRGEIPLADAPASCWPSRPTICRASFGRSRACRKQACLSRHSGPMTIQRAGFVVNGR
jgi:hypothetical protein